MHLIYEIKTEKKFKKNLIMAEYKMVSNLKKFYKYIQLLVVQLMKYLDGNLIVSPKKVSQHLLRQKTVLLLNLVKFIDQN